MPSEVKPPSGKVGKRWLQSQIKTATSMNSKGDVHCSYINDSVHRFDTSSYETQKLPAKNIHFRIHNRRL